MKCSKVGCSWMIHAVAIDSSLYVFKIKKYVGRHTCGVGLKLRSPPLTKKLINHLIHNKLMYIVCSLVGCYPLTYALVSGETIECRHWFMKNLEKFVDSRAITFFSDRYEGLLRAIPAVFPNSHHNYCYYHLKKNMSIKKFDEKYNEVVASYKKAMYALAPARYEEALGEMKIMGRAWVATYLRNIPPKHWSSAFLPGCRFVQTSSSVAESFNNWVRDERKFPACPLVDTIRRHIMDLMSKRREESFLMDPEKLTPTYEALLEEHIQMGRVCNVSQSDHNIYEVHSPRSHCVDLKRMTFTCQRWSVYGFPCSHATDAISAKGDN
ncbi:uncharacterized protein LOC113272881 [Papaver somniferum]|uniref:uncharacterized protein LOC113272881 n=1 Tax=Papaver somniferum TaxID=3469 RepID=UPI000E6F693B|nr:uncharacterized protein LOC113272881 [Papaver somniferum]